jgi:hypothetical protein
VTKIKQTQAGSFSHGPKNELEVQTPQAVIASVPALCCQQTGPSIVVDSIRNFQFIAIWHASDVFPTSLCTHAQTERQHAQIAKCIYACASPVNKKFSDHAAFMCSSCTKAIDNNLAGSGRVKLQVYAIDNNLAASGRVKLQVYRSLHEHKLAISASGQLVLLNLTGSFCSLHSTTGVQKPSKHTLNMLSSI